MSARRTASILLRLAAVLVGLLCLLFLAGVIMLHTQPRLLLDPIEKAIAEALPGSHFTALSVRPSLWPSPGAALRDIVLRLPGGNALFAESLECHLDWQALFQRKLRPSLLVLDGFNARLLWPDKASAPALQAEEAQPLLPEPLHGLKLLLRDGHLELLSGLPAGSDTPLPAPLLDVRTVSGELQLPAKERPGALELRVGSLRQTLSAGAPLSVPHTFRQIDIRLDGIQFDSAAPLGLRLRGATANVVTGSGSPLESLALQVQLSPPQQTGLHGNFLLEAVLRPDAYPATARARLHADVPFVFTSGQQWTLHLNDGRVALDDDNARLTMTIRSDATASGTARVAHLSLPHWFSFARALPDGLVTALDALSGTLTFCADAQGVDVPELRATLAGHAFTGSASLKNFQRPVLRLKASTQTADIRQLLPELYGMQTPAPVFAVPPLDADPLEAATSDTGSASSGTISDRTPPLDYDIRLQADNVLCGNLSGRGLHTTITPVPSNRDITRVEIGVDALYGGNATLILDIAERCAIGFKAKSLDARVLDALLPWGLAPRGTLNATATLSAPSDDAGAIIRNLSGTASVELLNGSLNIAGKRQAFSKIQLSTTGRNRMDATGADAPLLRKGAWKLSAQSSSPSVPLAPLDVTLTIDGETGFLLNPFRILGGKHLALRATGTVLGGHTDCTAGLDLAPLKGNLTLRNLKGALAGCSVQGDLTAAALAESPSWTARGTLSCGNLPPLLHHLGMPIPAPGASLPKSLTLSAALALNRSTLRLDSLHGKLDETSFQGSLLRTEAELPHWEAVLRLDRLNLTPYLPQTNKSSKAAPSDLPTARILRGMTANATLEAGELLLGDVPFRQVSARTTLADGKLTLSPCSAQCCGGTVSATLSATARPDDTTATDLYCRFSNVDLAQLSDTADADVRLRGKGSFETRLTGAFRTLDQAFAAQSGTWSMAFGAGSFTTLDPHTKRPDATYQLHGSTASGTLKNEIVTCNDLRLQGKDFNAKGRGIVNLRNNTLDYTINASIPGVPNIPIRYSGSLSDPTRRINAFKTLTGVLGNVGRHAFSIMKDIINVPFSLIK
ncbi:MAG TPA: hypothetical protein IAB01_01860 [Candidatus Avidesulfovibrio excrementigallinarum]|nr:hypothetical protein [Candidatus Avidesulfovibrio excrementigallinarum]